jgi:CheY-like chemotaxis protein
VFMIEDNGRGIAAAMLPRVFELFMQSPAAAESHPEGLGVGLMLVERLVKLHGGSVAATSPGPGKGSTFTVRLPVLPNHQPEPAKPVAKQTSVEHKTMRILLVEDNEDVAQILKTLLQRWGHVVSHANTGKDAMRVVGEHAPDVVLLDIGLPDMNGYEVAGKLREQTETCNLKLVAMTGYRDDGEPNHDGLFDQRLLKPVDFRILEQLLQTMAP